MGLMQRYYEEIVPAWCKEDGIKSPHAVPRVAKVILNMGLKDAVNDKNVPAAAVSDLGLIAGQQSVLTKARKSIAGFKLREGMIVGARVTLRRQRMYHFLDRLIHIALPRVRDFRGLSGNAFDGRGNYSLGLSEQIVFPEINIERIHRIRGLDIAIATTAATDESARRLLLAMGMPIR